MKKIIRVGIIGQGRSGRDIHGQHLITRTDYKIVAVADPLKDRRERAEKEYGCVSYDDHRKLLKRADLDLVLNCTPSYLHVPVTLEVLKAKFNVLCEKPLARRAADVDKLIRAARKARRTFAIFQQSRFAPYFQQVKKVIDSGVLGRIVMIKLAFNGFARRWDWQTLRRFNGGNLLNTGPHPVDQALQLFGTDAMPDVMCIMDRANTFGDAEDHVKVILRGRNRPTIDLEISSCCAYPQYTYNVYGTRGGLNGTTARLDWKYFKNEEQPEQKLIKTPLRNAEGLPIYCYEPLKWNEGSWQVPDEMKDMFSYMSRCYYDMLYRTLAEKVPLAITPVEVRQQIAVMEECHRQNPPARMPKSSQPE